MSGRQQPPSALLYWCGETDPTWATCCCAGTFKGRRAREAAGRDAGVEGGPKNLLYFILQAGCEALSNTVPVLCHRGQEAQHICCTYTWSWVHNINALYFLLEARTIDLTAIPGQRDRIQISSICLCTEILSIQWGMEEWPTQTGTAMFTFLSHIFVFSLCVCVRTRAHRHHSFPHDYTEPKEAGIRWWKIPLQKSLLSNSISYWVIYSSNCLENGLFQGTKWHLKLLEESNAPPPTRQSVLFSYVALGLLSLIPRPRRLLPRQRHPQIADWSTPNFHLSLWIKWVANMIKYTKINFQAAIKRNL